MSFPDVWEDWQEDRPATRLLPYAAESWPIHYKRVQAPDEELRGAINNLFEGRTSNIETWRDWHSSKLFNIVTIRDRKVHPFHIAISLGLEDIVADQIRKRKDVLNIRSSFNAAALHYVCFFQSKSLAELLINNGAELDAVDESGGTPLFLALEWGNIEIAEVLLSRGASVTLSDKSGQTPLHIVAEQGNVDLARQILDRGADLCAKARDGWTPLLYASKEGHCDVVKLFLERGANYLDSVEGYTAVGLAAFNNHVSVIQMLLDQGADIEATADGVSPLGSAVFGGHIESAEFLLDRGAAVDGLCDENTTETPLYLALSRGNQAVADLLLSRGAVITALPEHLDSPLYKAAVNGQVDLVQLLLQDSADAAKDGYAALEAAINNLHLKAVETLFKAIRSDGFVAKTPLHVAAKRGSSRVIKVLLNAGADEMAKDSRGQIPLFYAAEYGNDSAVDLLSGKDYSQLTCVDNLGRMPMHYACVRGHLDVVSWIVFRLPNTKLMLDARDHWGSTPLSLAAREGYADIVKILLATKLVDKNSRDDLGRTVEWWATQRGHSEILTLITGTGDQQAHDKRQDEGNGRLECDICCSMIFDDVSYHCGMCNGGDFDICADCFERGGKCLDGVHKMTLYE